MEGAQAVKRYISVKAGCIVDYLGRSVLVDALAWDSRTVPGHRRAARPHMPGCV